MDVTGKIQSVQADWKSGKILLTLELNEKPTDEIDELSQVEKLSIKIKRWFKKRSLDANALMWACLGELAMALNTDKWSLYLLMLKRYGQYTYICVKPNAVESMKKQWRECEEVGKIDINGDEAVQLLCYFGSSTYNSKEFSVLLDGIISEMKDVGIPTPTSQEMQRALDELEKRSK